MLVVAAPQPLPGNELFDGYMRGLRGDLDAVAAANPYVEVVWHPSTHAMIAEDSHAVADLIERFLPRIGESTGAV